MIPLSCWPPGTQPRQFLRTEDMVNNLLSHRCSCLPPPLYVLPRCHLRRLSNRHRSTEVKAPR
jgi:hypothetical protein